MFEKIMLPVGNIEFFEFEGPHGRALRLRSETRLVERDVLFTNIFPILTHERMARSRRRLRLQMNTLMHTEHLSPMTIPMITFRCCVYIHAETRLNC
ncbi:hypothetical protein B0H11DRAFT_2203112, partial [Mycena galericulata]